MLKNALMTALVTTVVGVGFLASAEAQTAAGGPSPSIQMQGAAKITPVATVKMKTWVYVRKLHGPRYRHRHGHYVYSYHGYWYAKPWWRHMHVTARRVHHHAYVGV